MRAAPPRQTRRAQDLLLGLLGDGPRPAREVVAEAQARGIPSRTLGRARVSLGVESRATGDGRVWALRGDARSTRRDDGPAVLTVAAAGCRCPVPLVDRRDDELRCYLCGRGVLSP